MYRRKKKLLQTREAKRSAFIEWLRTLQNPNRIIVKKATGPARDMLPMLEQTAVLHLAVYDGIILDTDAMRLHILLQDLPRNPRKGDTTQWPIPNS